jgi:hypothetical protein
VSRAKRYVSRLLLTLYYAFLCGVVVLLVVFTIRLLALYPCVVLFTDQLLPFLLAQVIYSTFPGMLLAALLYVLLRTFGAGAPGPALPLGSKGDAVCGLPRGVWPPPPDAEVWRARDEPAAHSDGAAAAAVPDIVVAGEADSAQPVPAGPGSL